MIGRTRPHVPRERPRETCETPSSSSRHLGSRNDERKRERVDPLDRVVLVDEPVVVHVEDVDEEQLQIGPDPDVLARRSVVTVLLDGAERQQARPGELLHDAPRRVTAARPERNRWAVNAPRTTSAPRASPANVATTRPPLSGSGRRGALERPTRNPVSATATAITSVEWVRVTGSPG